MLVATIAVTIKDYHDGEPFTINEEDFDAAIHQPVNGFAPAKPDEDDDILLPDGFPGLQQLNKEGITYLSQIEGLNFTDLLKIPGVGKATAVAIIKAANELVGESEK